jgi:hypothetical protein
MFSNKDQSSRTVHILGLIAWFMFFVLVIKNPSFAANPQTQQNIIGSYGTNQILRPGILVQISPTNPENVIPASQQNITKTFGVVISVANYPVSVNKGSGSTYSVYVSSSGNYQMIVSDQNGPISIGDYLTMSSVGGIAMKDNVTLPVVVGQASTSFNGISGVIGSQKLLLTNKSYQTVHLGVLYANVYIAHNPLLVTESSIVPSFLVNLSKGIAGRVVSPWRMYIALIITLAICVIVGSILYGAVRSNLTTIGRNQLSWKALFRGFIQVIILVVIIFISGLFLVYLLLRV